MSIFTKIKEAVVLKLTQLLERMSAWLDDDDDSGFVDSEYWGNDK